MARQRASSVPLGMLNGNFPFVYIARETQRIVSYETMQQCWTELNDTLASVQNDMLTTAAVSTFSTYRVVVQYRARFVRKAKDSVQCNSIK